MFISVVAMYQTSFRSIFPTSIFMFVPFREVLLRNSNRKFFYLTCPPCCSLAVCSLPDQRETAQTIEQASQCRFFFQVRAHPLHQPKPLRQSDRVAQSLVPWAVSVFVLLSFAIRPVTNVGVIVRKSLQPFTFNRGQAANNPTDSFLCNQAFAAIADVSCFRFQC